MKKTEKTKQKKCKSKTSLSLSELKKLHKELREYLQDGFSTIAESVVFEDGKLYQILCLQYVGDFCPLSDIEQELGKINIQNKSEEFVLLLNSTIAKKQKIRSGLVLGGYDTLKIDEELKELEKLK